MASSSTTDLSSPAAPDAEPEIEVYLPDSARGPRAAMRAPSPASLAGLRIAVVDNGKPNAALVMARAAETLAVRTGAEVTLAIGKGPGGLTANAAIAMAPDTRERLLAEADLVITGTADCGSCTAYSVHDAIELETGGTPAVVVTTTKFEPIAVTLSAAQGLADTRRLVLPHPIGGTDPATLQAWADAAVDQLIALFTARS